MTLTEEKSALVRLLLDTQVLLFGDFTLKSGRKSPYFFNLAAINSGAGISALGDAYARCIVDSKVQFSCVFGPAYKGIPIAVATAEALARAGHDVGWAFNRKEAKAHGEGGVFVGSDVQGRIVLVDDVLTAGTAVREAAALIFAAKAELAAIFITMDRQEIVDSGTGLTAVQTLQAELGIPVKSLLLKVKPQRSQRSSLKAHRLKGRPMLTPPRAQVSKKPLRQPAVTEANRPPSAARSDAKNPEARGSIPPKPRAQIRGAAARWGRNARASAPRATQRATGV